MKTSITNLILIIIIALLSLSGIAVSVQAQKLTIECYILSEDQKDNNYRHTELTDRSGSKVIGFLANKPFLITGDLLTKDVTIKHSSRGIKKGKAYLNIPLTVEGQRKMFEATSVNLLRRIAIFVKGELVVAPRIQEGFSGPLAIEGGYTDIEAQQILNDLQSIN